MLAYGRGGGGREMAHSGEAQSPEDLVLPRAQAADYQILTWFPVNIWSARDISPEKLAVCCGLCSACPPRVT